jgi:hypothetical protein
MNLRREPFEIIGLKASAPLAGIWKINSGSPIHDKANVSESRGPKRVCLQQCLAPTQRYNWLFSRPIHVNREVRSAVIQWSALSGSAVRIGLRLRRRCDVVTLFSLQTPTIYH